VTNGGPPTVPPAQTSWAPNPGWNLDPVNRPNPQVIGGQAAEQSLELRPSSTPEIRPPASTRPTPLPARPASIVPQFVTDQAQLYRRKPWQLAGLVELGLALPWLWWSWLSIQFLRLFSDTAYWVVLVAWLVSAAAVMLPRTEHLLAWKVYRLRPPHEVETLRIGPAWHAVCLAAGVDPDRYRVWIHEGPEATAPITAGSTIAVTSWAAMTLPPRHLESVLAHELAHHLALPSRVSLLLYWLQLPARGMGKAITSGLTSSMPVISLVTRVVLGFFIVGVFVLWWIFGGLDFYVFMMLTPMFAPWVVQWAARRSEFYADRMTADLGYGVLLSEVFSYREAERAKAWASLPRQPKLGSQPLDSVRLRALEKALKALPEHTHQPR
jgi:Zn-dependent protease with chaperone function